MRNYKVNAIGIFLFATLLSTVFFFQNCAEVQYVNPKNTDDDSVQSVGNETSQRYVYLKPVAESIVPTVPFKVLLVIDDSDSMVQTNQKLKDSIRSLLVPLRAYPVQLKIITTSRLLQSATIQPKGWSYKVTGLNPNLIVSDSWKQMFNFTSEEVFASGYDVFYSLNQVDLYSILAEDPDLEAKIDIIKERIVAITAAGTGDYKEQGLCNALLALYDEGPYRIFQPGDKAAIVVLSDENDASSWHNRGSKIMSNCHNRYTYGSIGNPTLEFKQKANYNLNTWNVRFQVSYDKITDGTRTPGTSNNDNGGLNIPANSPDGDRVRTAAVTAVLGCSEANLASAQRHAQYLFPSPVYENVTITKCEVKASWTALYGFGSITEDRCINGFRHDNEQFLDMADYFLKKKNDVLVTGSCKKHIQKSMAGREFSNFYIHNATDPEITTGPTDLNKPHQPMIQKAIVNRALELFGEEGFSFTSIVHKDQQCIPSSNQSVGQAYMDAGKNTSLAHAFQSISICQEEYDTVLASLAQHIQKMLSTKLTLPKLNVDEKVAKANIIRGPYRIPLVMGTDYQLVQFEDGSSLMQFTQGLLQEGDVIEVQIIK